MEEKINKSILSETVLEDMKEKRTNHMEYLEGMERLDSDVQEQVTAAMQAYGI